LLLKKYPK